MSSTTDKIRMFQVAELNKLVFEVLMAAKVRKDVSQYVTDGLVSASLRGIDSHGIRLLPHYITCVEKGRINPDPKYKFEKTSASTGKLNGDHTFGHGAGMEGMKKAIEIARESGTGHVAVYNSSHFGAAAFFAFEAAKHDMVGMSFTNATPHVLTTGGKTAFFGNNPVCFVAPCEDEEPFCLDMATSAITFNKVLQHKTYDIPIPSNTVADESGEPTTDPDKAKYLLPIGDYKGYGLSMMVDIMCSLFSGMPCGGQVSEMYNGKYDQKRYIGHYFMAIRIDCFEDVNKFKKRLSNMMMALRAEPRRDDNVPILIPGDPEKITKKDRLKNGIPVKDYEYKELMKLAEKYRINI